MVETILPEIEKYNAVGQHNFVFPEYDAIRAEKKIEIYVNHEGELLIMAMSGPRYVYWLSVTGLEDTSLNEQIYHRIAHEQLEYVTEVERALEHINRKPEDLQLYYKVEIAWKQEARKRKQLFADWETPFGHEYRVEATEENGALFVRDIREYVQLLRECSLKRECDGCYAEVLRRYREELGNAAGYNAKIQLLLDILEKERYLLLSSEDEIRELYRFCYTKCIELKNNK